MGDPINIDHMKHCLIFCKQELNTEHFVVDMMFIMYMYYCDISVIYNDEHHHVVYTVAFQKLNIVPYFM